MIEVEKSHKLILNHERMNEWISKQNNIYVKAYLRDDKSWKLCVLHRSERKLEVKIQFFSDASELSGRETGTSFQN